MTTVKSCELVRLAPPFGRSIGGNMSGEIEALGALTTAGLAASVVDGDAGQSGNEQRVCANCATPLSGRFCSNCGQTAHLHRTVGHLVEEFAHGILHVDTKAWRTLPRLVFQPGGLTRDYVHGKRARYITPLAMFLFTVFLMFLVFGSIAKSIDPNAAFQMSEEADSAPVVSKQLAEAREDLTTAEAKLAEAAADPGSPPGLEGRFAGDVAAKSARVDVLTAALERAKKLPALSKTPAKPVTWQDRVKEVAQKGDINVGFGGPETEARVRHTLENPDLALYKIQQTAYKFSFLLVPLSLPFLWLLFPFRRGITMYDHTVFALYSLSFMSLLLVTMALMSVGPPVLQNAVPWLIWAIPLHMYAQLKGAYELGWKSAVWRTLWLLLFSSLSLSIFALSILLLGLID